jgi:hypothetical protein
MASNNADKTPDLRLIDGEEDGGVQKAPATGGTTGDLVSEIILASGLLPQDKIDLARGRVAGGGTFADALVEEGFASSLGVARSLAEQYHLPLVDLAIAGVDAGAAKLIPLAVLERVCAIPFASDGKTIKVAITNPQDVRGLDELKFATRLNVVFHVAARSDVLTELRRLGRAAEAMNATFLDTIVIGGGDDDGQDDLEADDGISDAPLVRLVNSMIFQAAEDGASDIHVEPQENELVVRYRIDGVLHVAHRVPKRLAAGVTTRLKVLAKLDIAERRKPQDGRITLTAAAAGRMLDVRVATLPTVEGEAVTMRLLDKSREVGGDRPRRRDAGADGQDPRETDRRAARHRPDGLRKVDDALREPRADQPGRNQHHHGRGPGRVPALVDQPGSNQYSRRTHVRERAAVDPSFRPGRGDGRRDPRR